LKAIHRPRFTYVGVDGEHDTEEAGAQEVCEQVEAG
jgi:hypothetical protein